jgi:transcriptional regulator of acetoin/glycerol metabolism
VNLRKSKLTGKPVKEVLSVLNRNNGELYKSAVDLGVAPNTLYRYIRKNKLQRVERVEWMVQS